MIVRAHNKMIWNEIKSDGKCIIFIILSSENVICLIFTKRVKNLEEKSDEQFTCTDLK